MSSETIPNTKPDETGPFGRPFPGLYVTVVQALGAQPRFFKAEVMAQAQQLLEAEEGERHRRVVIVVDEAHLPSPTNSKSSGS